MEKKIKISLTINKEINELFNKLSREKSINKSLFVENAFKKWIKENKKD